MAWGPSEVPGTCEDVQTALLHLYNERLPNQATMYVYFQLARRAFWLTLL